MNAPNPLKLLTIAGTDPSSGAGLQADLNVFRDYNFHGLSVVTAVVAQNTTGVVDTFPSPPDAVKAQLDAVAEDFSDLAGIKIGLIPNKEIAETVGTFLETFLDRRKRGQTIPVVHDPVLASGINGVPFGDDELTWGLLAHIIPQVNLLTPNIPEALAFANLAEGAVHAQTLEEFAKDFVRDFNVATLLKGGHLDLLKPAGDDPIGEPEPRGIYDVLCCKKKLPHTNYSERVVVAFDPVTPLPYTVHGTGCQLSSAILSELVLNNGEVSTASLEIAIRNAQRYLQSQLRRAVDLGHGSRVVFRTK